MQIFGAALLQVKDTCTLVQQCHTLVSYMESGCVRDWLRQMMSPNSKFGTILDHVCLSEVRSFRPSFDLQD